MLGSVGGHYRPEDVYIGDYAGALEALNGGVTTLLDWSHILEHPGAFGCGGRGAPRQPAFAGSMRTASRRAGSGGRSAISITRRTCGGSATRTSRPTTSSVTLALAARAPGNSNFEVAAHDWALARELGIRITVHVGMRLTGVHVNHVKNISDLGLLGPDTTYIHCTDSTDEELDLIAESGGTASVAPYVEMLMGHGHPPTGSCWSAVSGRR